MSDARDYKKAGFSRKVRRDEQQHGMILATCETGEVSMLRKNSIAAQYAAIN
jgi:hypothetical protein